MDILDGKTYALERRAQLAAWVAAHRDQAGRPPGLTVVLAGEDPASATYVRSKERAAEKVGVVGAVQRLPSDVTENELLARIEALNVDPSVDGILVQLPLPPGLDEELVLDAIAPSKDVDGFHPSNSGLLWQQRGPVAPCTPLGIMHLLAHYEVDLSGMHAVVVGRSNIVGKPMAQLLLDANCTVTVAHSRTDDLPSVCREADILIAAVGRPQMIKGDWIKPGATVIDVGINRVPDREEGKTRLVGDVDFEAAVEYAGAITPVPGGVGPMTIACLLRNTLVAACQQNGVEVLGI